MQRAKAVLVAAVIAFTLAACGATSGAGGPESGNSGHPGVGGGPIAKGLHRTASTKVHHHNGAISKPLDIKKKKGLPTFRHRVYRAPRLRTPRAPRVPRMRSTTRYP